ncbi:MAG: asparagine synthase (glutamine-hydrolyzing) [Chitinophagaceae bacterium]
MCGIAGIIASDPVQVTVARLQNMTDALAHRGPNGFSTWISPSGNTGLAHRRLSIIDLSNAATQPMHYLQRYTIVHNGEIYNYTELKHQLQQKGYQFHSQSDTEVILAAYDCYKEQCLQYFDGMFAFCIWDEQQKKLFAARDRFGEKPFYYYSQKEQFIFSSEIKGLWAAGVAKKADDSMLLNYLTLGYTSAPADPSKTFYQHITALPAAHYLQLSFTGNQFSYQVKRYWDLNKTFVSSINTATAEQEFRDLFFTSVQRRLRSDVPLGTSLSGGLDSSSVVAAIKQLQPGNQLKTFSAVFPGFEKDESIHIKRVSQFFGVENQTIAPTAEGFLHDLDRLLYYHDEPISSMSVYAQYKVFELVSQHNVTVMLDGQGADELLGGYTKHIHWRLQELLLKQGNKAVQQQVSLLRKHHIPVQWGWKNYLAALLPAFTAKQLKQKAVRQISSDPFVTTAFKQAHLDKNAVYKPAVHSLNDILYADSCLFGLPELLRNADRNSMAHGKEVRLPFLSHELAQFIFTLPAELKIHEGYSKRLLRMSMKELLPPEITWRTDKIGFEPPQQQWLQQPLVQDRIHEAGKRLVNLQILEPAVLDKTKQPTKDPLAADYNWRHLVAGSML